MNDDAFILNSEKIVLLRSMINQSSIQLENGKSIEIYTFNTTSGASIQAMNYGGIVSQIKVPDSEGQMENICLGFDDPKDYLNDHPCFGTLVGRFANRIAKGQFMIDGQTYSTPINNGENTLHGGPNGFDKAFWNAEVVGEKLKLSHTSPDGDAGFPGTLKVEVIYEFTESLVWRISYRATTDQATPINLTQHSYFNLKGAGCGTIVDHEFEMMNRAYTPINDQIIPTGEIRSAFETDFDFSQQKSLRERFDRGVEYDHNLVLPETNGEMQCAAMVYEPTSGRKLEMWTTEPAFQFYTANFLDGSLANSKGDFEKWGGFCLEAQNFPDAVNHSNFPNSILRPGEEYTQVTEYRFS